MPSLNFVLPHWAYWLGLILFPIVAMVLSRSGAERGAEARRPQLGLAYFIWLVGGFLGLHRFYLENLWGFLYLPLFVLILFANAEQRMARDQASELTAALETQRGLIERNGSRLERSKEKLADLEADLAALPEDSLRRGRTESALARERERVAGYIAAIAEAEARLAAREPELAPARAHLEGWRSTAFYAFLGILAFLLFDAVALPRLVKASAAEAAPVAAKEAGGAPETAEDIGFAARGGVAGLIDRLCYYAGEFVAFWAVIAVFVYYYEVLARYLFNSPTNWAHEAMFLMFGMQYLIAGAYAMLTDSHVRVDVFYAKFSPRGKALSDLLTSVFFFIFAGTLLFTGYTFAMDSISANAGHGELSFTEWQIQYWPVKVVIVIGAALLALQGVSKILKDLATLIYGAPPPTLGGPAAAPSA